MSHQTKQESIVTVTSLDLLSRAVQCVQIERLGTHLVFDMDGSSAKLDHAFSDRETFIIVILNCVPVDSFSIHEYK